MILENGSFQALLGMKYNSLTKSSAEITIFPFKMAGGSQARGRPIITSLERLSLYTEECQGAFEITFQSTNSFRLAFLPFLAESPIA